MVNIIILFMGTLCVLVVRVMRGLYSESTIELKRRARSGDIQYAKLYKLKSSNTSQPEILLILFLLILLSLMSVFVINEYNDITAAFLLVIVYALILTFGFIGEQSVGIASSSAIVLEAFLRILKPILNPISKLLDKLIIWGPKKSLSSKAEVLALIEQNSAKSRLSIQEKKAIEGALSYGDKIVRDIMIPNSVVNSIDEKEMLSPVVISELHDSGHSRFPVYSNSKNVVGTLYIKDVINLKSNIYVKDVMRYEVYYLNEEQNLQDALKGFLKTKHHLFMVVNSYEDIVGIITIEDVLEQIIGAKIIDEFDQYDDLKIMAEKLAQQKREERA